MLYTVLCNRTCTSHSPAVHWVSGCGIRKTCERTGRTHLRVTKSGDPGRGSSRSLADATSPFILSCMLGLRLTARAAARAPPNPPVPVPVPVPARPPAAPQPPGPPPPPAAAALALDALRCTARCCCSSALARGPGRLAP